MFYGKRKVHAHTTKGLFKADSDLYNIGDFFHIYLYYRKLYPNTEALYTNKKSPTLKVRLGNICNCFVSCFGFTVNVLCCFDYIQCM